MNIKTLLGLALIGTTLTAQDGSVSVPISTLRMVRKILPERSNQGASYLSDVYDPNLVVSATCQLSVTLIWEAAGYRNTLGWFRYLDNGNGNFSILESNLLIANASFPQAGSASVGDVYDLRDSTGVVKNFQTGDRVGFFIIADGWRRDPNVQNWNPLSPTAPSSDPFTNRMMGRGCYTSIPEFNPEMLRNDREAAKHIVMVELDGQAGFNGGNDFILCGFEDLNRLRNADNDFNDLIFAVNGTPESAISTTNIQHVVFGDTDNDGIGGTTDQFPTDPDRAFILNFPTRGHSVIGIEDRYPLIGDADFNDACLAYSYEMATNSDNEVKDIMGTYHIVARGAAYDHNIGIRILSIPPSATGTIEIERMYTAGTTTDTMTIAEFVAAGNRIDNLIPSTTTALPPPTNEQFSNTLVNTVEVPAGSVRFKMTLDTPMTLTSLGLPPFDTYVGVKRGADIYDIHLPGIDGFLDRPVTLPDETGPDAFIDDNGYPWMMELPTEWRFPLERVPIWEAYPRFALWVTSGAILNQDWYANPSSDVNLYSAELAEYIPLRKWILKIR